MSRRSERQPAVVAATPLEADFDDADDADDVEGLKDIKRRPWAPAN